MRWFATSSALVALASWLVLPGCGSETPDDSASGGDSGTGASSGTTGTGGTSSGGSSSGSGGNNGGTGATSGGASSGMGGGDVGGSAGTGAEPGGGTSGTDNTGGSVTTGGSSGAGTTGGSANGGASGGPSGGTGGSGPDVDQNGKANAAPGSMTSTPQDYLRLGEIRILNNNWGSEDLGCDAQMSVFVNEDRSFGWNFNRGDCDTAASNQHPDFPQVEFGIHPFGIGNELATSPNFSSTTLLPLQIKDISSASVTVQNLNISLQRGGSWNITFEFWLSTQNPNTQGSAGVHTELMTFWGWQADRWPSAPGADGSADGGSGTGDTVTSSNKTYTLWVQRDNWADGWRYYQFRDNAGPQMNFNGTVNVKPLLDYLVNTRSFSPDLWVTRLEVGSEIDDNTQGTVTMQNITFEVNGQSRSPVFGQ